MTPFNQKILSRLKDLCGPVRIQRVQYLDEVHLLIEPEELDRINDLLVAVTHLIAMVEELESKLADARSLILEYSNIEMREQSERNKIDYVCDPHELPRVKRAETFLREIK